MSWLRKPLAFLFMATNFSNYSASHELFWPVRVKGILFSWPALCKNDLSCHFAIRLWNFSLYLHEIFHWSSTTGQMTLRLLTCIRQEPGSNIHHVISYPFNLSWFLSVLSDVFWDSFFNRLKFCLPKLFRVHETLLPFYISRWCTRELCSVDAMPLNKIPR